MNKQKYREIPPRKETGIFIVLASVNNGFDYFIHQHPEYELTSTMRISGTRIVGNSAGKFDDCDLVLFDP